MRPVLITVAAAAAAIGLSACGSQGISVPEDDPAHRGAVLFAQRCAGCHTLSAAGAQGSANRNVRVQGPNLDQRQVSRADVLLAIRNGGFSGGIMPQNIVTGREAQQVADFVAEYSGQDAATRETPTGSGQ